MANRRGGLALVLHAHLPFVRHPEHPTFLEERWLFEAITESYLPLLERFRRLAEERVPFRLTMSITPTLLTMLADPFLQARYLRHLDSLIELAEREIQRTRWLPVLNRLARFYHHRFTTARQLYVDTYHRNLIGAMQELAESGHLELMASCATHAFLPLFTPEPSSVRAQIRVGLQAHEAAFGSRPAGFWLPECGFQPGHDALLAEEGVRYVVMDAHGILFGSPRPAYGVFAPVACPSGLVAFGRDLESSKSVWSAEEGYPGDPVYREFYRDIGHELDDEYLRPYLSGDGARVSTGIKYYRITGKTEDKQPYDPDRALEQAVQHAAQFVASRTRQVKRLGALMDREPLLVSPYDAELFGHWWFEGPDWIEQVIRKVHTSKSLTLLSLSDYLARHPINQPSSPSLSSWGEGGYSDVWLSGANDWTYRHLHAMAHRMSQLAHTHREPDAVTRRALNQMARELLLAQSSDWAFILKTKTHTAYAYQRLHDHMARFAALEKAITASRVEEPQVAELEAQDNLFPFLDYRLFAPAADSATPR